MIWQSGVQKEKGIYIDELSEKLLPFAQAQAVIAFITNALNQHHALVTLHPTLHNQFLYEHNNMKKIHTPSRGDTGSSPKYSIATICIGQDEWTKALGETLA